MKTAPSPPPEAGLPAVTPWEKRLEANVEIGTLCAFYGGLLTPRQREALRLHYEEDLSLGEIAEQMKVSRQNVHELIARSADKLRIYEAALGGARRTQAVLDGLGRLQALLLEARREQLPPSAASALDQAQIQLQHLILTQEDDHGV